MKKIRKNRIGFKIPKWAKGAVTGSLVAAGAILPASQVQAAPKKPKKPKQGSRTELYK